MKNKIKTKFKQIYDGYIIGIVTHNGSVDSRLCDYDDNSHMHGDFWDSTQRNGNWRFDTNNGLRSSVLGNGMNKDDRFKIADHLTRIYNLNFDTRNNTFNWERFYSDLKAEEELRCSSDNYTFDSTKTIDDFKKCPYCGSEYEFYQKVEIKSIAEKITSFNSQDKYYFVLPKKEKVKCKNVDDYYYCGECDNKIAKCKIS